MKTTWMGALRLLAAGRRWWAAAACLLAAAGGMAMLWLWAPVATGMDLAIQAGYALGALGCLVWALAIVKRRFAGGIRPARVLRRAEFWGALAVFGAAGVWLPAQLAAWAPRFGSLAAEAASAAARLAAAWLLFTGAICWLAACAGMLSSEDGKWKENSGFPTEKSSGS